MIPNLKSLGSLKNSICVCFILCNDFGLRTKFFTFKIKLKFGVLKWTFVFVFDSFIATVFTFLIKNYFYLKKNRKVQVLYRYSTTILAGRGFSFCLHKSELAKTCKRIINLCELSRKVKVYLDLGLNIGSRLG